MREERLQFSRAGSYVLGLKLGFKGSTARDRPGLKRHKFQLS
jgi:hypothetical protein